MHLYTIGKEARFILDSSSRLGILNNFTLQIIKCVCVKRYLGADNTQNNVHKIYGFSWFRPYAGAERSSRRIRSQRE